MLRVPEETDIPRSCTAAIGAETGAVPEDAARRWAEDLDEYARFLEERHIDLYHTLSRTEFLEAIEDIKSRLPKLDEAQVIVELMRLTRRIGDGHTSIPPWERDLARFPLEVVLVDGEVLVTGAAPEHTDHVGSRVLSIDGIPSNAIIEAVGDIVPFVENPYSRRVRTGDYFLVADLLHALGLIRDRTTAEFALARDDTTYRLQLDATPGDEWNIDSGTRLCVRGVGASRDIVQIDEEVRAVALHRDRTVLIDFQRYPTADDADAFAMDVLDFINRKSAENLIIDLRDNSGGNFFIGLRRASLASPRAHDRVDTRMRIRLFSATPASL